VRRASAVAQVPVIVTENGIGTTNDAQRIEYLEEAITGLHRAMSDGVEVHGYFQWSLLDNFEWLHGYRLKFGIVEVDRGTFQRTPKPSAHWYGELARTGVLKGA
jgi:beta-glucosidase